MSEYQYYEFLALDRLLTAEEIAALRDISSRAEITSATFINHYEWGDLKADPLELLGRFFDVFVYVASWGTHRLALRLPRAALEHRAVKAYLPGGQATFKASGEAALIDLFNHTEDWGALEDFDDGHGWMAPLAPLRGELLAGDVRPLYLAWLCCVQEEDVKDQAPEPPVPPGLGALTPAQACLVAFLRLDPYLLAVAAAASGGQADSLEGLDDWIAAQPPAQKDRWLQDLATGRDPHVRTAMLRRFHDDRARKAPAAEAKEHRTAGELRTAAAIRREAYERKQARRAETERRRREAEAARAREAYLTELAGRQHRAWDEIEQWAVAKQPKVYDQAVALLQDLRDVAHRTGDDALFVNRLAGLMERHSRKPSLMDRLRRAGLTGGVGGRGP